MMSRFNTPGKTPFFVVLAIALVLLVACGGGQAPSADPTRTATLSPGQVVTPGRTPSPGGFSPSFEPPGKSAPPTTMVQPQPAVTPATTAQVSFARDLAPVIKQNCGACHIDQSMGGLSLRDHNSLTKGGQSGSPVVNGNPDGSLLVRKLRGDSAAGARMPMGGPYLDDNTIKQFADWIAQGAQNN